MVGSAPSVPSLETSFLFPTGTSTLAASHVTGSGSTEASASFTAEVRFPDNKEGVTSSSYLPHRRGVTGATTGLISPPVAPGAVSRKTSVTTRVTAFPHNIPNPTCRFTEWPIFDG